MRYYSLNKQSPNVSFREATIQGQAPDKGLYFPEEIPRLPKGFVETLDQRSNEEIALEVIRPYIGDELSEAQLAQIVAETVNFPVPLKHVAHHIYSLELFHGPTLAFKDIGARFMSRCLGAFVQNADKKVTVLVATSGDTGGAVANGFYDVPGVEVVILYPSGKVSPVQEKQLTCLGKNIKALEVKGSFDDCQRLVKQAFADEALRKKHFLTSANSINVARWLPQQFYYFLAWKQSRHKDQAPVISVPSGNFGNICAGVLAWASGLPVKHFIAACNANDTVTRYLQSGAWDPKDTIATFSNAMDVAHPSNFIRIMEIFEQQLPSLKNMISSARVSDATTLEVIRFVAEEYDYLLDPHGAVAYEALVTYLQHHPGQWGYLLETAHPVKFPDAILKATGEQVPIPDSLQPLFQKEKAAELISTDYAELVDKLG